METGLASNSPPPQISGAPSISPENNFYIKDLVIECKPDDANNIAFNAMRITVFGLGNEDGDTLHLEKVAPAMWKHESAIELPTIIDTFTIIAQSEQGGDLGRVYLAGDELKGSTTSDNHVRREFITEVDGPTLTLSFQTCVIPSDGSTVEQGNQDVSEAATTLDLELGFATIGMIPDDDPEKPDLLIGCGRLFLERFRHTGSKGDIDNCILAYEKTIKLVPRSDVRLVYVLSAAGDSFLERYAVTGSISDIDQAISMFEIIVDSSPEGHGDMCDGLNDLGALFSRRFERTGDLTDISKAISVQRKAVRLTPKGHPDIPAVLNNLGHSLLCHFERTGDISELSEAVSVLKKSVDLTPNGHSDMPMWQNNLGMSLRCRFELTGDLSDLSEAISSQQNAVHLTPNGHLSMPGRLNNLGISFRSRFERMGDLSDMSEAISLHEKTIHLTPNGHSDMPSRLNDLGNSLTRRFERTGDLSDISEAISLQQKAVHLTPNDHVDMPVCLNSLGISLRCRFELTEDLSDISESISVHQKAVHLSPNDHSAMPSLLNNLGNSLLCRFEHTEDLSDITEAISMQEKAVHLTPNGHSDMPGRLYNLGHSMLCRLEHTTDPTDIGTVISNFHLAATSFTGSPSIRLRCARKWAELSHIHNPAQTLDACSVAIRLLSQVAGLEQTIQRRQINLIEISHISTAAAATAFSVGNYGLALEWLEQGRCLVWNQLNNLRTPLDDLRACEPTLADHFSEVSRALENSGSRTESGSLGVEASMASKMTLQAEANAHVKLAQEWEQLLSRIRDIPDFQDFLQPPQTSNLLEHLPGVGTVVVINVHKARCDALALLSGADAPHHIPLPHFSHEQADSLRSHLHSYLRSHGVRSRGFEVDMRALRLHRGSSSKGIQEILSDLWLLVVKPILDDLEILHPTTDPSRIWWCATGPLAFLPIHAAGIYGQSDKGPGHCLSDFAISSYTPTVSALIERVKHPREMDIAPTKLLLISQPNTPGLSRIPGTTEEIRAVMTTLGKVKVKASHLEKEAATIARVSDEMATHSSIHLACHAIQDVKNPLQSGFFLHDGRLELSEIIKRQTTNADLAFLSACQTSSGDEKLSEEAVHLAAGMLAAGYRGVVATMWSIMDCYGTEIAADFYENLLSSEILKGEEGLNSAGAAHALHYATRRLRSKLDDSESALLAWVPYVHFGL